MSFLLYILSILTEHSSFSLVSMTSFLLTTNQDLKNKNYNWRPNNFPIPVTLNAKYTIHSNICIHVVGGEHFTHAETCGGLRLLYQAPPFFEAGFSLNLELVDSAKPVGQ